MKKPFGPLTTEPDPGAYAVSRSSAVGVLVYGFLFWILRTFLLTTARYPDFRDQLLGPRVVGLGLYDVLTAIHVLWMILMAFELRFTLAGPSRPHRSGQAASVLLAMVVLAGLQMAAVDLKNLALSVR